MKFSELIKDIGITAKSDFEVAGLTLDSRMVKPNYIFFALQGTAADGAGFIKNAVENGAKAVFSESVASGIDNIFCGGDTKRHLNIIAERFYRPLPDNLVAVTGTNGKTSIANFVAGLLSQCGKQSASCGTLGILLDGDFSKQLSYSGLTSPDIISLMGNLKNLKNKGIEYVALEASSHGLHQGRIGNLRFKVAAFTNFTQDHLDYHGNMEDYLSAKSLLFSEHIVNGGTAVLNADIPEYQKLKTICDSRNVRIMSYGRAGNDIKIINIKPHDKGLNIEIEIAGRARRLRSKMIGEFQADNMVCAVAVALALDLDTDMVLEAATNLKPVKGRMDIIDFPKMGAKVVIDYAHTPDALEKAIDSLRKHTSGKLITLVGCGGDRDRTKRPLMGKIASEKSDVVIITDDNPRTEDASTIRKEVLAGTVSAKEVAGRKQAIAHAISLLGKGDSLLLAGKGHEDYQIIGKEKTPFDEFKIVREILGKI